MPHPESSWLLSRAALQEGAISDAVVALAAAGSYRGDHPLDPEPSPYVGEARCSVSSRQGPRCPGEQAHLDPGSRQRPSPNFLFPTGAVPDPDDHECYTCVQTQRMIRCMSKPTSRIGYCVRSSTMHSARPSQYFSLVGHETARRSPYILRLSHYQDGPMTRVGFERPVICLTPEAEQNFLGKPIDARDGLL